MRKTVRALIAGLFLLAMASPAFAQDTLGLANPASTFCSACGGSVEIVGSQTGETGYCVFPSGFIIEEWSWFYFFFGAQPTLY